MRFIIVYGSVRKNRLGIRAAKLIERTVSERGHEPILIDPLEYDFGLLERMYKEYPKGEAPEKMEALAEHIRSSHAIIVVSAEYNHSIPPALSNLMDHFLEEWFFKPSLITTYSAGGFGGVRAGMQLRALLGEIGTLSVPSMVAFSRIGEFAEDGTPPDERTITGLNRALSELEWYADAIRAKKDADGTP
jgi:NAD(P)H-dependent FMN reductase